MKREDISQALGAIREEYIQEAADIPPQRTRGRRAAWCALAACLCLVAGAAWVTLRPETGAGREAGVPGGDAGGSAGSSPEGAGSANYSVAVYPGTEDPQSVMEATVTQIDGPSAYGLAGLGAYLPDSLPEGYSFSQAWLYETTMDHGGQYHLLRATYSITPPPPTPAPAPDGEAAASEGVTAEDPALLGDSFSLWVMDYRPDTEKTIHTYEELEGYLTGKEDNGTFFFSVGDVYVGVEPLHLSAGDLLDMLYSVLPIPDKGTPPDMYLETEIIPGSELEEPPAPTPQSENQANSTPAEQGS